MKSFRNVTASLLGAFTLISAAYGQVLTYTFEGEGHNSGAGLPFNFDGRTISFASGIPATVAVSFDLTGATDSDPGNTGFGAYVIPNASLSVNVSFAGGSEIYTYTGDLQLYVYNNYTNPNGFSGVADGILLTFPTSVVNGNPGSSFDLQFYTTDTGAFSSDSALSVAQMPSVFGSTVGLAQQFRLFSGESGESTGLSFNGYSTGITAIPEPSTYAAFFGLGALALGVLRRRNCKQS